MSRRGVGMLVGVVALVLVVVIAGGQAADGDAYDPDTTGPAACRSPSTWPKRWAHGSP